MDTEATILRLMNSIRNEDQDTGMEYLTNLINLHFQQQERIATALEQLTSALYSYDGRAFISTRSLD